MTARNSSASAPVSPAKADDLKRIDGIGPAIAQRLYKAGILTFARLAALSPDEVIAMIGNQAGLSVHRITEENWIGQARVLAAEVQRNAKECQISASPTTVQDSEMVEITENPSEARDPTTHPRSAIFSIQLELRPDGSVRRTLVKRARTESGEEESDQWLGWNAGRLVAFIEQYAQLRSLTESSGMMLSGPIVSVRHKFEPITAITEQAVEFKTYAVVPADMPVEESMDEPTLTATIPASSPQTEAVLSGVLHIRGLETSVEDREGVQNVLNPGEPLHLRFLLDLSDVIAPPDALITYKAAVYAKQIGGPRHLTIAEGTGSAKMAGSTQIELTGQDLPSGLYRLMAIATLSAANRSKRPQLTAFLESGPVEVPNPA